MVEPALRPDARIEPMTDGDGEMLVWEPTPRSLVVPAQARRAEAPAALPGWLRQAAPQEARPAETLRPSGAAEATPDLGSRDPGGAAERGSLIHRLLQSLPDLIVSRRADAARHYLERAAPDLLADHDDLVAEVLAVLDDPVFAPVFGPGSIAEVPLIGQDRACRPPRPARLRPPRSPLRERRTRC